jgi:hypothetical protein
VVPGVSGADAVAAALEAAAVPAVAREAPIASATATCHEVVAAAEIAVPSAAAVAAATTARTPVHRAAVGLRARSLVVAVAPEAAQEEAAAAEEVAAAEEAVAEEEAVAADAASQRRAEQHQEHTNEFNIREHQTMPASRDFACTYVGISCSLVLACRREAGP